MEENILNDVLLSQSFAAPSISVAISPSGDSGVELTSLKRPICQKNSQGRSLDTLVGRIILQQTGKSEASDHPHDEGVDESTKILMEITSKLERQATEVTLKGELMANRSDTEKGPLQNTCKFCGKQFSYMYALRNHMRLHDRPGSSSQQQQGEQQPPSVLHCNQCQKPFKHNSTLLQHVATVHQQHQQPYACDLCPKTFNRISTLKSHRKIHSGVKNFVCFLCQKGFYQKGNLKNHMYIHTNERPYRCDVCGKVSPLIDPTDNYY